MLPSLLHSLISGEVLAVSKRGPLIQITEFEFLISPNPSVSCLPSLILAALARLVAVMDVSLSEESSNR